MRANEGGMQLRPYQLQCVYAVGRAMRRGLTRMLYVLPTGAGKTAVACDLIRRLNKPGRPALIIAHREELLVQAWERLHRTVPDWVIGMERAGHTATRLSDVVVASVQTLGRRDTNRLDWLNPSLIWVDEAHHAIRGGGYDRIFERFGVFGGSTILLGCTATPKRLDRTALHGHHGAVFQEVVFTYGIREAIEQGYLCQIRGYRVRSEVDLTKVKTTGGDYNAGQLAREVNIAARTERAIEHWREVAEGRKTLVFCVGVQHAKDVAQAWRDRGYAAESVDGSMARDDRAKIFERFRKGETDVLANCEIATEGLDIPEISCIVHLRPTKSWSLYMQMTGRGTRLAPNKRDLVVIDCVDNCDEHSLATVPGILDLPPSLDLEGHSLTEAARKIDDAAAGAAVLEKYQPASFSELLTTLEKVDLLAQVEPPQNIAAVSSFAWLAVPGGYLLNAGGRRTARIWQDALGCYRFVMSAVEGSSAVVNLGDDIQAAFEDADRRIEASWPDCVSVVRSDARWRHARPTDKQIAMLRKFKVPDAVIAAMTKGQASGLITQKFAKK